MGSSETKRRLIRSGVVLLLLGLVTGALIPLVTNALVTSGLVSGSLASLAAMGLILWGLGQARPELAPRAGSRG